MSNLSQLFRIAMKRELHDDEMADYRNFAGTQLNLGAGKQVIPEAIPLCRENGWEAQEGLKRYADRSIAVVHAYHFLEHLTPEEAIFILQEVQRVLIPGGIFNICVPYAGSHMAFQDITHKTFWNEETFQQLFNNVGYDPLGGQEWNWELKVRFCAIVGLNGRNLALLAQLVRHVRL